LQRLEAMRDAAARLMARDRLGRDVFARGAEEKVATRRRTVWTASLIELMRAYARIRTKDDFRPLHLDRGAVFTMEQALERMRGMLGTVAGWAELSAWLPEEWKDAPHRRRSATAGSFAAALELVKAGRLELRQEAPFRAIYLKPVEQGGAQ
jgi:segregation and condensation protein A